MPPNYPMWVIGMCPVMLSTVPYGQNRTVRKERINSGIIAPKLSHPVLWHTSPLPNPSRLPWIVIRKWIQNSLHLQKYSASIRI